MEKRFAVVTAPHAYLRSLPGDAEGTCTGSIEDEIFSGWCIRLLEETKADSWFRVQTHYGYQGYLYRGDFREMTREELEGRQDKESFFRITIPEADLLAGPKVQELPLELLHKNAIVEKLPYESTDGYSRVRAASGKEGFVHSRYLAVRMDDDGFLLAESEELRYFRGQKIADEEAFREAVVTSAKAYLGTQYRWGGKSSQGIDCSGLAFMSYMENGVLIYRDARLVDDYPIRKIKREQLKKGDLLYFPGHVAIYLGHGKYIHSTGYVHTPYVTINSLCPEDDDYREDLDRSLKACGSLFPESVFALAKRRLESFSGNISCYYKNLVTGETFSYRSDAVHPSASLIKTFLMAAVYQDIQKGRYSEEETLTVRREDMVHTSGVLDLLMGEPEVPIRDLIELMIVVSDNTAANLLYQLVGTEQVNRYIKENLKMEHTVFNRKMMDRESAAKGIENYTTAEEMALLLEKIYCRELVSPEASQKMYETLCHQQLDGKIPFYLRGLEKPPLVAHKTGENDGVTHDAAIIEGHVPMILCFLGSETDIARFERVMADITLDFYEYTEGE